MLETRVVWDCSKCGNIKTSQSSEVGDVDICKCGKSQLTFEDGNLKEDGFITIIDAYENIYGRWRKKKTPNY